MLVGGLRFAPMMFDEPGIGRHVRGELYSLDTATLASLDQLEALGLPGNTRAVLNVLVLSTSASLSAWAYFKARHLAVPAHTGYLEDYRDRRFTGPQTAKS